MRPTNRSVVARQQYKRLDGGWREDFLLRATRIDEGIPKKCCDGEEYVNYWEINPLLF